MQIYFSIPDYYNFYNLNLSIIQLLKKYPNKFYQDIIIDNCYGCFPNCLWSGGRSNLSKNFNEQEVDKIISSFNKEGVSIRHIFTNQLITKKHLIDKNCNFVLELSEYYGKKYNIQNTCTIYQDFLNDYIQKFYPSLKTVWSTTKEIQDINEINRLSKNNLTVVSYAFNNNFDKIINFKHPSNIEFLCAEQSCLDNCPNREEHYYLISKSILESNNNLKDFVCPRDQIEKAYYYSTVFSRKSFISIENIRNNYLNKGFNKFKISGRGPSSLSLINLIENYIQFFVKPSFQNEIRNQLLLDNLFYKKNNLIF